MSFPFDPHEVSARLLVWYGQAGRDLPWRHSSDPYSVWLSEIMLQQTGVVAVIPYYQRFLARFPDVAALAAAPVDDIIALWAGLGYYSRARNLHTAARLIVQEYGGVFPADLDRLTSLPGVGRSTAGAILSIAFARKAPILDGNVRRVLARLFALEENPRSREAEKRLWVWAEALTPEDNPHDYAQAIMDLGATLCVPRRPACMRCPLEDLCQARQQGREGELPVPQTKKKVPEVMQVALLVDRDNRFLVRKRPLAGMLGGLWEFPGASVPAGSAPEEAAAVFWRESGGEGELEFIGGITHAYSHFRLDLRLYRGKSTGPARVGEEESLWLTMDELTGWPLHGAHKKALPLIG
jgi:A/G-specific adenine glycosylase